MIKIAHISKTEASLMRFKNRGHQSHVAGTGAHKNKKAYSRKVKHKNREW